MAIQISLPSPAAAKAVPTVRLASAQVEPSFVSVPVVVTWIRMRVESGTACVTATVRVMPPPVTVMVPERDVVVLLAVAVTVNVPLLLPLAGETVSHEVALLLAVHETFDVTATVNEPAVAATFWLDLSSVRNAPAASCVTATVRERPPPVTVIVPERDEVAVLAVAVTVNVPLLLPLAGETVNHEVALLLAVHETFDVTVTVNVLATDARLLLEGSTVSVAPAAACVTGRVRVMPPPVTVIVPERVEVVLLAVWVTVRVPLLLPLGGATVNHDVALLLTCHETFDVTATLNVPAVAATLWVVLSSVRNSEAADCVTSTVRVIPPVPPPVTVIVPLRCAVVALAA